MRTFNSRGPRDDRGGNRFGKRNFRDGGRDSFERRGPATMHKATCAECGNSCEVPFRPTGDRPVLCKECFRGSTGGSRPERSGGRQRFEERQMYSATCAKCGESCEVPFRPAEGKPVYCSNCFEGRDSGSGRSSGGNRGGGQMEGQLTAINKKLDRILEALAPIIEMEVVDEDAPGTMETVKAPESIKYSKTVKTETVEHKKPEAKKDEEKKVKPEEKKEKKSVELKKPEKKIEKKKAVEKKPVAKKKPAKKK